MTCAHKIGTAVCTAFAPSPKPLGRYCRTVDYSAPFTYDVRWCARGPADTFDAQVRDFWPGEKPLARNGWY